MKKYKILIVSALAILFGFVLINKTFAQNITTNEGFIKGKIIDNETKKNLQYVTIALFKTGSDKVITGTMSDLKGDFEITDISPGNYSLVIDFMGYNKQEIAPVKITNDKKTAVLKVYLKRSVNEIEEVEITADRNTVDYKIDKKVVNVSKNISASGGSAVDALENVPSVQTDIEGNVTLRGSSSFTVLIDGKPTVLDASDALQQIPASLIESIEIITNPSAKYDPDGTAGIINVITKKNEAKGMTGQISASFGTGPSYTGNVYLKYNMPKFSISGSIDYSLRDFKMTGFTERFTYLTDVTESLITETEGGRNMERFGANLGFDYYITKNNTFSIIGKYRNMNMNRSQLSLNGFQADVNDVWEYYLTDDINVISPDRYSFTITDVQKFNKKGHELVTNFYFSKSVMNKNESIIQYISDQDWLTGNINQDSKLITEEDNSGYKLDLDYTIPVRKNGTVEAGFQWRYTGIKTDFNSQYLFPESDDVTESDNTNFVRQIYAGYATYSDKFGKLDVKLGLRSEYTDRILEQFTMNEDYVYKHFDLYPSAYLTYNINKRDQLQINYSKRLNRPRRFNLNPFVMYSDGFSMMKGNPELEPEYSHVAEVNFIKKFNNSFFSLETFFRQTNNKVTRLGEINEDGILVYTSENLNSDRRIGGEAMLNLQIFKWWNINLNGSIYQYQVDGNYDNNDLVKTSTNWNSRATSMFKLGKSTVIQVNGMYNSPSVSIDGTREDMFFVGAALKQDFFKKKLSLSLNVQDIFDTRQREGTTSTESYYIYSLMKRQAPFFRFQVTYKINNLRNVKTNGTGEEGGYDMYME